ncbi:MULTISPECIES: DUF3054 domain-containing protein [Helcobacillus]|uniref:DUF3054 family protein n=1 Tax=Helcobacillus massiliensis TaxID=521392 RepID=A0A839QPD9_9MICO|nr:MULTISPECIES: DUF3054 domain-containing protein [Helcobacillus]MBB3021852.1 hypothetical protein [Helcobacillus massiliensis]MCG7427114.1 DUF3054 domain-containing protein [Helcobacillus sp. ACRRO]MDK7742516.1 DUF3054 domain-containing protein [Helcobacillus massiliensis]WOO93373.1 DUF3054 domain-containing protein [Helcobacillus massiliensis]
MKKTFATAVVIDIVCVIAFTIAGILSHGEALSAGTLFRVGAPFLVGLLLGHAVTQSWRTVAARPAAAEASAVQAAAFRLWPHGVLILAVEIATAMVIRSLIGDGTATSFVIVSVLVNAALLLGWRAIARAVRTR